MAGSDGFNGGKENSYRRIERELGLPPAPPYSEAERRHFIEGDWSTEPLQAGRVERFVVWCIDHQVGLSVALWAAIMAAGGWVYLAWFR